MEKGELVDTFNDHLSEFLSDIYRLFPDNGDVQAAKNSIIAFKAIGSKKLIKNWKEDITNKYSKEIYEGDLDFFINKDYGSEIKQFDISESALDKIECLRTPIKNMSDENKQKTIQYLQNLTRLAEIYE